MNAVYLLFGTIYSVEHDDLIIKLILKMALACLPPPQKSGPVKMTSSLSPCSILHTRSRCVFVTYMCCC